MNFIESILLGILQGITEFLPVSSSGHLIILEHLLGQKDVPMIYDIVLHVASLLAVLIFFRRKVASLFKSVFDLTAKKEHKYILFLIVSTCVTGLMVFATKPVILFLRETPSYLSICFVITGIFLITAQILMKKSNPAHEMSFGDALFIGFLQGIAVLPGVSRSGSTISAGLMRKISGETAVEYSFMLSIPAILGALVLESGSGSLGSIDASVLAAGFVAAFAASMISLKFLVFMIRKTVLYPFAIFVLMLAMAVPFIL